jgi:hypothetical protein
MTKIFERYYRYVLDGALPSKEEQIVFSILYDLRDRRGLRQEWDGIDDDIQEEILKEWIKIVKAKIIETK